MIRLLATIALGLVMAVTSLAQAGDRFIVLASTTSTDNSGLFADILPQFEASSGIAVRVVAVGTGQALRIGRNGDADVLLVHDRASEEEFVADGFGTARHDVMYNDFVLVGPEEDPAGADGLKDIKAALKKVAAAKALFASRGDDSGTHRKEQRLWQAADVDAKAASGQWYRETGSGMGATLNTARGMGAYVLVDRATWTAFGNKTGLKIISQGDPMLFNPYGVMLVNPERHPHVRAAGGQAFVDWLVSPAGQAAIAGFAIEGQQLFFPNAGS